MKKPGEKLIPITVITVSKTSEDIIRNSLSHEAIQKCDTGIKDNMIWVPTGKAHIIFGLLNKNGLAFNYKASHFSSKEKIKEDMMRDGGKSTKKNAETKRERIRRLQGLDRVSA